jgi:hypothetical protein
MFLGSSPAALPPSPLCDCARPTLTGQCPHLAVQRRLWTALRLASGMSSLAHEIEGDVSPPAVDVSDFPEHPFQRCVLRMEEKGFRVDDAAFGMQHRICRDLLIPRHGRTGQKFQMLSM